MSTIPSGSTHFVWCGLGKRYIKEDGAGWKYWHEINKCWYYYDWTMNGTPIKL